MSKPQPPTGARCATSTTPYLVNFGPIMPNHFNIPKIDIMGALLLASDLRISNMNFYPDWKTNGRVISQKSYSHLWTYAPNLIDFGPLIGQISTFLNKTNFI